MTTISIGRRKYEGELVSEADSARTADQPRWSEFYLYHLDDGRWLIHRIGKSVIYHTLEPDHRTATGGLPGETVGTVDDLPDDAEPCDICRPEDPDYLADGQQIRIETDRHKVDIAATPAEVTEILVTNRRREGGTTITMSRPVRDLLTQAARRYPEFAEAVAASA